MSDRGADLRVFDEASRPVTRWLRDLDDVLGAIAVAGLAWPDEELATDLRALGRRGSELGVEAGSERLGALAEAAERVRSVEDGGPRTVAERDAFEALMAVVGWARRFRSEVDLLRVQAALVVRGTTEAPEAAPRGLTATISPLGAELSGDRLVIFGRAREDGEFVVLQDRLVEVSEADPAGPVISRLFQARLPLRRILSGDIALVDHPVSRPGGIRTVRPVFDAAAALRAPGTPMQPELLDGDWPRVPVRSQIRLGREGERVRVELEDGEGLPVPETALLRFTATKAALRGDCDPVEAVLRRRREAVTLLSVEAPEGRCFPTLDPRALPLDPGALAERTPPDTPAGLWTRAVLRRSQGVEEEALAERVATAIVEDVHEAWTVARAARVMGRSIPAPVIGFATRALAGEVPPDDRWRAIWLILTGDVVESHVVALNRSWETHYEKAPSEPTAGDVCARAVLMDLLDVGGTDQLPATERAVGYLEAHLAAARLSARSREPTLPSLEALAWLAETRLMLTGEGGATPLRDLDLPPDRLRLEAVEALWRAFGTEVDPLALGEAGDAVWALRLAGLEGQLFVPGRPAT